MYPQKIHHYLQSFFKENDCPILSDHAHYLIVQLTVEMDKKMMNRPYYWQYIEATGDEPIPAQLTFITNKNELTDKITGEVIHAGSPRLSQIFSLMNEMGAVVRMYEVGKSGVETILTPWVIINYKVSYYSHQTKEFIYSLGMNLMTGEVLKDFQESLLTRSLQTEIPKHTFCLPYTIKPENAVDRLDAILENVIRKDDHTWAEEAKQRWEKEKMILDYFYEDTTDKPERYQIEQQALAEQYEANIQIDIINGGLFYLAAYPS